MNPADGIPRRSTPALDTATRMEALLYRHLVDEIQPMLLGRRLERIYSPRSGLWTFRLQPADHPRFLLFAHHPAGVALTLSPHAPENPPHPSAQVMRLRKHLQGRRILRISQDWPRRRLALGMARSRDNHDTSWLVLDAKHGVFLVDQLDAHFQKFEDNNGVEQVAWPTWEQARDDPQIWQSHPHVTPLLRQTLQNLSAEQGRILLDALQSKGHPTSFFLYRSRPGSGLPSLACPWPLPEALHRDREEQTCSSALMATSLLTDELFFAPQGILNTSGLLDTPDKLNNPDPRTLKRLKRLRKNLDMDETRLRSYLKLAEQAQLIHQNLYLLPAQKLTPHSKVEQLAVPDSQGRTVELPLDKSRTILENMQRWFQLADKGRRGLEHLQRRRAEFLAPVVSPPTTTLRWQSSNQRHSAPRPVKQPAKEQSLPLHRFLSSDGFVLLRGKNQKANHTLLTRLASPFDYWFHAADGPGAHLILKRDSPNQDVPEQTLEEAAGLAGLASHFAHAGRATVICAQVKHVRTVKGVPGMAKVDQIQCTLHVALDIELENRLRSHA